MRKNDFLLKFKISSDFRSTLRIRDTGCEYSTCLFVPCDYTMTSPRSQLILLHSFSKGRGHLQANKKFAGCGFHKVPNNDPLSSLPIYSQVDLTSN